MARNLFSDSRMRSLQCTGAVTFKGAVTYETTVAVTGATTLSGALNVSGTAIFTTLSTDDTSLPATTTASGQPGQILVPNTGSLFLYTCVATNTWARVAVSTTAFV